MHRIPLKRIPSIIRTPLFLIVLLCGACFSPLFSQSPDPLTRERIVLDSLNLIVRTLDDQDSVLNELHSWDGGKTWQPKDSIPVFQAVEVRHFPGVFRSTDYAGMLRLYEQNPAAFHFPAHGKDVFFLTREDSLFLVLRSGDKAHLFSLGCSYSSVKQDEEPVDANQSFSARTFQPGSIDVLPDVTGDGIADVVCIFRLNYSFDDFLTFGKGDIQFLHLVDGASKKFLLSFILNSDEESWSMCNGGNQNHSQAKRNLAVVNGYVRISGMSANSDEERWESGWFHFDGGKMVQVH